MGFRQFALVATLALAAPSAAAAQIGRPGPQTPAYRDGYERGITAGTDDRRHGDRYNFTDERDYQRADSLYRNADGPRDLFRTEFRRGFESGYRIGYEGLTGQGQARGRNPNGAYGGYGGNGSYGGYDDRYGYRRDDLASENGYKDGLEAGQKDFRGNRRYEPFTEGRYKSGDHGYKNWYGTKDAYRTRYRDAFVEGYRRGYSW